MFHEDACVAYHLCNKADDGVGLANAQAEQVLWQKMSSNIGKFGTVCSDYSISIAYYLWLLMQNCNLVPFGSLSTQWIQLHRHSGLEIQQHLSTPPVMLPVCEIWILSWSSSRWATVSLMHLEFQMRIQRWPVAANDDRAGLSAKLSWWRWAQTLQELQVHGIGCVIANRLCRRLTSVQV